MGKVFVTHLQFEVTLHSILKEHHSIESKNVQHRNLRRLEWKMKLEDQLKIQHLQDLCGCLVLQRPYETKRGGFLCVCNLDKKKKKEI